ncbi:MAG: hypothetical protein AABY32_05240 [Nanoarchaeota archaeon]
MNKIDKKFYKALKFLSRRTTPEILDSLLDGNKKKEFRKFIPKEMDRTLQLYKYILFEPPAQYIVTTDGLQFLRELEDIKRKDLTLIASVIAVIISLVALAKSMGWI